MLHFFTTLTYCKLTQHAETQAQHCCVIFLEEEKLAENSASFPKYNICTLLFFSNRLPLPSSVKLSVDSFTRLILFKESVDWERNFSVCSTVSSFPTLEKGKEERRTGYSEYQDGVRNLHRTEAWQCSFA